MRPADPHTLVDRATILVSGFTKCATRGPGCAQAHILSEKPALTHLTRTQPCGRSSTSPLKEETEAQRGQVKAQITQSRGKSQGLDPV